MTLFSGMSAPEERRIRRALETFPSWLIQAARISRIMVSTREDVRRQVAMYEHGTRNLYLSPGVGDLLPRALGHELGHAIDDNFNHPHVFTSAPEWLQIHHNQAYFDIPKYRDEPLEYFADMVTKFFMLGPQKLGTTNPDEVQFLTSWVFPKLVEAFGDQKEI